ncbi:MAG TPA: orotidine 5'-phosphate decarboxylase / HUMPS family protein, partial [Longimicrobiales bacterium]|nr:orotidine 5'-phosphate decarboxylase / HUMPS family protein [Longimicrobiales bacterium]
GPDPMVVTPGIRLPGADRHDQARVAAPDEAVRAGASHLVVGRAVTQAADPLEALRRVRAEMVTAPTEEASG